MPTISPNGKPIEAVKAHKIKQITIPTATRLIISINTSNNISEIKAHRI
jgi:hypothetical protein